MMLLSISCINLTLYSQNNKFTFKTVQLFEQKSIHLNGGNKAAFSPGKKSRIFIQIDLPPNTVEWYYSFSTSTNQSSTENLNLFLQLGALFTANLTTVGKIVNYSNYAESLIKQIKIPPGCHMIDVYLFDKKNVEKFINKEDNWGGKFQNIIKGSTENSTKDFVRINNPVSGVYYLGLRNPSLTNAVDIIIEAVAVVKEETEIKKTIDENKAELYYGLGSKAFETGDYDKALPNLQKALQLDSTLVGIKLKISLIYLIQGKTEYLDSYIEAISSCKNTENANEYLIKGLNDIYYIIEKSMTLKNADEIINLLKDEIKKK
jgi:hypothetical protein